jgi:hypothetical protein
MDLTIEQKRELRESGLVRLPGILPRGLVEAALLAINASLGERGLDHERLPIFRAQSYCPELRDQPPITDLYNASPLKDLAESAIGRGQIEPVRSGQIALRFPTGGPVNSPTPHIDGMYTPTNGVPEGTIANFTALVGVFLSDIPHDFMGNFSVWLGSHHRLERYFREHTPQSLLDGMPPIDLGEVEQVRARAGDAVLCHYQLAHGIAGNGSPFIRYGIFFRLTHVNHESVRWECMTDIWREWEGMRDIVRGAVVRL